MKLNIYALQIANSRYDCGHKNMSWKKKKKKERRPTSGFD